MNELVTKQRSMSVSGEMAGEHQRTFTSFKEGLEYLRAHPFGTLEHPDMDTLAFLYVKNDGTFAFLDVDHRKLGKTLRSENFIDTVLSGDELSAFEDPEIWDQTKYVYLDGMEMACRIDGIAWFEELRADFSMNSSIALPAL